VDTAFEAVRSRLFAVAYRMLGTVSDAEDIVQDAYLRWHAVDVTQVESAEAYLVTIVTRLCMDQLKKTARQRAAYIGPWLPEPILQEHVAEDETTDPGWQLELADHLSMAFVTLLQQLTPQERAVFILREAFDFKYAEIAEVVQCSESHSRQLNRRARQKILHDTTDVREATTAEHEKLLLQFIQACSSGRLDELADLLAEDVTAYSDGGGKVVAVLRPLHGRERVLRFLRRVIANADDSGDVSFCRVNGELGLQFTKEQQLDTVLAFRFVAGRLQAVYSVRNPDKLANSLLGSNAAQLKR